MVLDWIRAVLCSENKTHCLVDENEGTEQKNKGQLRICLAETTGRRRESINAAVKAIQKRLMASNFNMRHI